MTTELRHPMTTNEAGKFLGLTDRQVEEEIRRGRLKCYRILGNRIRITHEQCMDYIESHPCNRPHSRSEVQ